MTQWSGARFSSCLQSQRALDNDASRAILEVKAPGFAGTGQTSPVITHSFIW